MSIAATADQPQSCTVFTAETAVIAAKRSWLPTSARFKKPDPPQLPPQSAVVSIGPDLLRVKRQIDALFDMMDKAATSKTVECPHCKKSVVVGADAHELDQLSRAYDRLFKAWQVLSGTPGPGQRKVTSRQPRNSPQGQGTFHEPEVLPDPAPANGPTCGLDTPTGSVPSNNSNLQTPQEGYHIT